MKLDAKTRSDLGWELLVEHLQRRTHTARGRALATVLAPFADRDALAARFDEVAEARGLRDLGSPLKLGDVRDIDEPLQRAAKQGLLEPQNLIDIAATLRAARDVRKLLTTHSQRCARLLGRALLLTDLPEVAEPIFDAFEEGQTGTVVRLSDRASSALGPLRRQALKLRDELERRLQSLIDAPHVVPLLQDRFFTQRDDRFVLPIRIDARHQMRGILHGTSQSGQTVFIEPEEIVDLNNRLRLAELEVAAEERRILADLSSAVTDALPQIFADLEILSHLDLVDAAAQLSADLRCVPPEIHPTGGIDLRRARHPLMALGERNVVPNDIRLEHGHVLVLSGPNAGGKTVALKTAGLVTMMARCGLHVPAQEGSKVPWLDAIFSDVGDDQSLERNLSTFSAHILQLDRFLREAGPESLVLLDEVAVGTDPTEGSALAQAVLETLAQRGTTAVVTTHYDRLKALQPADPRFVNASVGYDFERLAPTYELHLGVPGASAAIQVAERIGLSREICERARSLLGEAQIGLEQLLDDLAQERRRLVTEREEAERLRREVEAQAERAQDLTQAAQQKLEQARRGAHDEAVEALRQARHQLDESRTVLRRRGKEITPAAIKQSHEEIAAAASQLTRQPVAEDLPGKPAEAALLKPGIEVFVARLRQKARVLAVPKGNKVEVQAGPLKLRVAIDELRLLEGRPAEQQSLRSRRGHNAFELDAPPVPARRGGYATLDVRGERVDVAIGMAEKFLDDALRTGQEAVHLIHGHGSGALRDGLRKHLKAFPGVATVRPATVEEGGDGTTVVTLS